MEAPAVKGRPYLRASVDRSGRERSPDEQYDEIAENAQATGVTLVDRGYRDIGSASGYARKGRDGFSRLLDDLKADRFGADLLILWEASRGSRRVSEWLSLIELCAERQVKIHVLQHRRTYDPANSRDRRSLLEDAVDSEFEAAKTSDRVRRAVAANAVAGRPASGPPPFGFRRVYHERTGALIGQEPDPAEVPIVCELFDRIEKGHALAAIARDFAERGITTRSGGLWSQQHLRKLLLNPAYDGVRVHYDQHYPATWPRLVSHRQWLAVTRILRDRARNNRKDHPGGAKYMLSLIGVCDVCGGDLYVSPAHGDRYVCHPHGHVRVEREPLDRAVLRAVAAYLSTPAYYAVFAEPGDDAELERVATELAEARAEWDGLADSGMSAALAARREPAILARIAGLERREDELRTPSKLAGLLAGSPDEDMLTRLERAPVSAQRTVMRMVLVPERLGQLRIKRSPVKGHRVSVARRIEFRRNA
jgi:DNA invertase Pin-like site-specific DNA recombinase